MFTGIVEELGEITAVERHSAGARLIISGPLVTSDAARGDSIAVNGVCLTVVDLSGGSFTVDVVTETVRRTSLASVSVGDRVNLERATAVGQRLGGHIVQGHVDGTGTLLSRETDGLARFSVPVSLSRYLVDKGSIAVDGVSLTVVEAAAEEFSVALIPTTLKLTILGTRKPGDIVNLEVDVLAKYVAKLLAAHLPEPGPAHQEHNEVSEEVGR